MSQSAQCFDSIELLLFSEIELLWKENHICFPNSTKPITNRTGSECRTVSLRFVDYREYRINPIVLLFLSRSEQFNTSLRTGAIGATQVERVLSLEVVAFADLKIEEETVSTSYCERETVEKLMDNVKQATLFLLSEFESNFLFRRETAFKFEC